MRGNPQFQAQIPAGHRISELELEARPAPGPLVWGASPETLGRIVHGVATERHISCDFDEPSTASGKLEGAWTENYSFATERGGSIAVEVSVSANFPFGSASGSVTGTVSSSVTKTTSEGMTLTFSPTYARMVALRHYFDAQLQITELRVEGQPFHMDIEVGGDARVSFLPDVKWIDAPSAPREMQVLAGSEPVGSGSSRRNLHICKAGIHPGKVVAGNCNWTYGGSENRARRYQMLSVPRAVPRRHAPRQGGHQPLHDRLRRQRDPDC